MTREEFDTALKQTQAPVELPPVLLALWHDAKGNWQAAHGIAQEHESTGEFDRLHAYLHRKEGDASNARYWYRRAGAEVFMGSLEQEWQHLVRQSLN